MMSTARRIRGPFLGGLIVGLLWVAPSGAQERFLLLATLETVGDFPTHEQCAGVLTDVEVAYGTVLNPPGYEHPAPPLGNLGNPAAHYTVGCWIVPGDGQPHYYTLALPTLTVLGPFRDPIDCGSVRKALTRLLGWPPEQLTTRCWTQ